MSLKQQITDDVKLAMRAKDKQRLAVLRLITAEIKQIEVDKRSELNNADLDDSAVLAVLNKMLKQRKDSITQFDQAGRDDLSKIEHFEVEIINTYMPEQLTEAEITQFIDDAMAASGASSMKDMGKIMGQLKPKLVGRADMGAVSQLIKSKLTG